MASALDRLLKKYTLEDSGSGDVGLLKKPATVAPAPAPTPEPATPSAPSLLTAGSPEYADWWRQYQQQWFDPVSGRMMGGVPYENGDPITLLGDWRGNDTTLSRAGATNVAFDPASNQFVGLDASGKPIESTRGSTLTQDNAFWNAALLAGGLVGGAVGSWAEAGNGMGAAGSGASTGALPTAATDATLAQLPADYLGQSAISGALPQAGATVAPAGAGYMGEAAAAAAGSSGSTTTPTTGSGTTPAAAGSWLDDISAWMKDPKNAEVAKLLFGAGGALLGGTSGSSGGGYSYTGPMPTISRQGWSPTAQQQSMLSSPAVGLLDVQPGQAMSGLWRYGLLGGGGK